MYLVEKETEKAVLIDIATRNFETKLVWVPKSACKIEEFVATLNPCTNKPETYGKRVVKMAPWLERELRFR